ncbi:unnamed protein product [marine sediment metagenome]|uniref:Uncharacterized protein n=1 Tax=marine sediment metagenome TaxID=412755 RepID=X1L6N0_9ZZZZ
MKPEEIFNEGEKKVMKKMKEVDEKMEKDLKKVEKEILGEKK